MNEYHKIQNVFKRDMTIRENPLIWEDWTCPEFGYLANNKWLFTEKVDGCLHYSNKVDTDQGKKSIGEIVTNKLPVKVLSYNTELDSVELSNISHYHMEPRVRDFLAVTVRSRGKGNRPKTIVCTDNHKFFCGGEWVEASCLKVGSKVAHYSDRLTQEQRQVILGGLLGDSSIGRPSETTRNVQFIHGINQRDYLLHKSTLLGKLAGTVSEYTSDGYVPDTKRVRMATRTTKPVSDVVRLLCEVNGSKYVNDKWCNEILPLGLAIWYMDDGSCVFTDKQRPRARLHTNGFSDAELDSLLRMLWNRFGIFGERFDYKGNTIALSADATERLFCIIHPHICQSMKYKIAKKYRNSCTSVPDLSDESAGICDTEVLEISTKLPELYKRRGDMQYDLTVEGNSNYFCNRVLVHNTNIRICWDMYSVAFQGRTENAQLPGRLVTRLRELFPNDDKFEQVFEPGEVCLYGEGYGAGIQKGGCYGPEQDFVLFDVKVGDFWLSRENVEDVANKLGLRVVPIITEGTLYQGIDIVKAGLKSQWGDFEAEGLVGRPATELQTRSGNRVIVKIKGRDFKA